MITWKVDFTCDKCGNQAQGTVTVLTKFDLERGAWVEVPQPVQYPKGWRRELTMGKQICPKC